MDFLKFIQIKKNGELFYYNCPSVSNIDFDCFNYMRSDLNRILLKDIPPNYSIINCDGSLITTTSTSSTTSSTSSTSSTTSITSSTSSTSSTSTSTSTSSTLHPCLITKFEYINFVNNANFPYDYINKQGWVNVKVQSNGTTNYQYKITSGDTIIKDWSATTNQNVVNFKLDCAKYTFYVKDADNIGCVKSLANVDVPCLTNTTSTTTTPCLITGFEYAIFINDSTYQYDYANQSGYIKVKVISTGTVNFQYRVMSGASIIKEWTAPLTQNIVVFKLTCATYTVLVRDANNPISCSQEISNITVPCLTTTQTTAPVNNYASCGLFTSYSSAIFYKNITTNVSQTVINNNLTLNTENYVSLYNGNIYVPLKNANSYRIYNLGTNTFTTKTFLNFPTNLNANIYGVTHDLNGKMYIASTNISKFDYTSGDYSFNDTVVNFYGKYNFINTSHDAFGAIHYISNINAFVTLVYSEENLLHLLVVKNDNTNLILKDIYIGTNEYIPVIFVKNNELYFTKGSGTYLLNNPNSALFKVNLDDLSFVTVTDMNSELVQSASSSTQNPACRVLNYNDQFNVTNIQYSAVSSSIFKIRFNIANGSGNYSYSNDNVGFTDLNGISFDNNYLNGTYFIYIKDNILYKDYKMLINFNGVS